MPLCLRHHACIVLTALGFIFCVSRSVSCADEQSFEGHIQPLVEKYCRRCHNVDLMKSGVRLDDLSATPTDRQLFLLKAVVKQLDDGNMPPDDEPQPTADERTELADWARQTLLAARTRQTAKNGSIRRLTVSQYRNTLRDLLGLEEDLTDVLPPDGMSKEGFVNQEHTLSLSPLQVEAYFDIAEQALDLCIVDERTSPVIQNFRVDLGTAINPQPYPDPLVLGAFSALLNNPDFVVTELQPARPFAYTPFAMRTKYDFIEGYVGNDTIREWRHFDSIYHSVFACMRGTPGYTKGDAYQVVPEGLLLRPAIPSPEVFGVSNTYGPMANFKISLRELPHHGNFRVRVRAARYDDALLLDASDQFQDPAGGVVVTLPEEGAEFDSTVTIPDEGIYQLDVYRSPGKPEGAVSLELGGRNFAGQLQVSPQPAEDGELASALLVVRLPAGELPLKVHPSEPNRLRRLVFSRTSEDIDLARRFLTFEKRLPSVGVHVGLRRDCGSTLTQVGPPQPVADRELREYVFEGAINDFPTPDVEEDNVNYLAGIREIAVRSEYTDGRDMPRLLVRSVEFEGPYYDSWPPETHRRIFIDSPHKDDPPAYAREILRSFATRAFRRPVTDVEEAAIFAVWQNSFADTGDFRQSIKDALLVALTSPQFLFIIENSSTPEPEPLDPYELASKLSYFLWNAPPDQRLLDLAAQGNLHESLDAEIDRVVRDPRFAQFVHEFGSQWLSLDKFEVVAVDADRFPRLTRDTKSELRREPVEFLRRLIQENLPLRNLVQSDFIMANEVVASYYGLGDRVETGFHFVPLPHEDPQLGGVLTQAAVLSGLSDGREANPVKRGAWLARKIIAEPPDDPPPNVPRLPEDDGSHLTLRQKLERHRNQEACAKCHSGIDPWGLPFEQFDAGGLFRNDPAVDARSTLPDGTDVADLNGLKRYLAEARLDQVAFSFLKHVACYGVGRSLTFHVLAFLQEEGVRLRSAGYRMRDMIRFVIQSGLFLQK
jgi:hypothetical protein